jgi:hypothetical protein
MIFELRYKQNNIKFGYIEINTLRELHRAFWDDIIDIDFTNGIIWLYTYVYEEPAFFPADRNLREGEHGVWNVPEGADMPRWQPKMPFTAYDSHDQYIGHLEVGSLEELSEVCDGSRLNLWFDEQELNVLPSE